jgi:hypothetical protein
MSQVRLKSVEFWRELRGPGPRRDGAMTASYSTMRVHPGTKDAAPSGLTIIWDREAHAIYIALDGATEDPIVVYGWQEVRRAIPVEPADLAPGELGLPGERARAKGAAWSTARREAEDKRKAAGG